MPNKPKSPFTILLGTLALAGQFGCTRPISHPTPESDPPPATDNAPKQRHEDLLRTVEFHRQKLIISLGGFIAGLQPNGKSVIKCEDLAKTHRTVEDLASNVSDELGRALSRPHLQNADIDFTFVTSGDLKNADPREVIPDGVDINCVLAQLRD